jgi:hypothetical protein
VNVQFVLNLGYLDFEIVSDSCLGEAFWRRRVNQKCSIMQNKPNFRKAKMNANDFSQKDYENKSRLLTRKNKPKQTQFVFFIAETAEFAELLLFEDLCQCNWIKRNYLPAAAFPLTLTAERDYNEIFS